MQDKRLKIIASNLKAERNRKSLSQEQLAELSGSSLNSIGKIERAVQLPSILMVYDISKALGIDIYDLLKNVD